MDAEGDVDGDEDEESSSLTQFTRLYDACKELDEVGAVSDYTESTSTMICI